MPKVIDHEQRRDEVAAVAAALIAERGLEVGLRDVAAAGGWSTSVVTHYFASKDDLLEHTMRRSIAEASRWGSEADSAGARLRAILEETLPLDARRRRRWRLFLAFYGQAMQAPRLREQQRKRHSAFRALLAGLLEEELGVGERDPDLEARRLFALIDGIAVQAIFEPRQWPASTQVELVNAHLADLGIGWRVAANAGEESS